MFHWTGFTKSACAEMVEAVPPGSLQQDPSWEGAWCGHVLPAINRISLRAGCKNHWKVCEGNNKPQKSNYWQKPRLFVVKQGYSCQRPQQRLAGRSLKVCCDFRTNQYNDSNSSNSEAHDLVEAYHGHGERQAMPKVHTHLSTVCSVLAFQYRFVPKTEAHQVLRAMKETATL